MSLTLSEYAPAAAIVAVMFLLFCNVSAQTGGDQILDGIGETSLLARFPLDGTTADRSRNGVAAKPNGEQTAFVDDKRFGKVLALAGTPDGGLSLAPTCLAGVESLTVTAWVQPRSADPGQMFLELGPPHGHRFIATLTGDGGFHAGFADSDRELDRPSTPQKLAEAQWQHLAVVFDATSRTVTTYIDGQTGNRSTSADAGLASLIDATHPEATALRIGGGTNGLLHDLRLYSVPLTGEQIKAIYSNARPGAQAQATTRPQPGSSTPPATVEFGGPKLVSVPDIALSTTTGQLPKLPPFVEGRYENNAAGAPVRVLWPSPKTTDSVRQPGAYTITGQVAGTALTTHAVVTVTPTSQAGMPVRRLEPFPLGQVVLDPDPAGHNTVFMNNRDKFVQGLLATNPDDFLYMFRDAFGQPQPAGAKPLGGWDSQTTRLRGHATGHYLSALAQAYAGSTDTATRGKLLDKMNQAIDVLYDLAHMSGMPKQAGGDAVADPTKVPPGPGRKEFDSDLREGHVRTDFENWGVGFISAYPPDQFIMLEHGATYGTGDNQIWAPYYTLHKILAGLLDCYEIGGNAKALDVARGMALWSYERLKILPAETRIKMWNRYIAGEYGGMNEVLARLGRLTGDRRFYDAARLFDNVDFFFGGIGGTAGLAGNVDTLRGRHANQHVPQIIGALETFADTGEPAYFRVAENFWEIATNAYAYSIGGIAGARTPNNAECFTAEPNTLGVNGFSEAGQNETCATYNMLKLSRGLFMFEPGEARYMDYYERALLNDILASVAEKDAGNTYHIPLNPGARKSYGNAEMDGFTCCNGTALESNTKLQDSIYFKETPDQSGDGPALYVNLFVPSTLNWADQRAVVKQQTAFPYSDSTRLTATGLNGVDLRVRVPGWATHGYTVIINDQEKRVDARPGSYVRLGRDWKDGDVVEIRMPFGFRLDRVMDRPNLASICYGPVVLAAEERRSLPHWRQISIDTSDPSKSITGDPAKLRFKSGDLTFKPFFESYGRYSVYFDIKPTN